MKKTYYIFRHGLTQPVKEGRWYWGSLYSAVILDEAKPSIIRIGNFLKNIDSDYNVTSPFKRCIQTSEIVTEITGKKFVPDRRLSEYTLELPWNFKKRVMSFINEMENSEHKTIIICTHAVVLEMLIQYFTNGRLSLRHRFKLPLTGVLTIIKDKKISSKDFNEPNPQVEK
jgi:broad specificity phosphatase PhoE